MYECIKSCIVSDQFGDDAKVELGSKWKLEKQDFTAIEDKPVTFYYLRNVEDGRIAKVMDSEMVNFKEV